MGFRPQHRPLGGFSPPGGTLSNMDMANIDRVPNGSDTEVLPTNMSNPQGFSTEDSLHSEAMPGIARAPEPPPAGRASAFPEENLRGCDMFEAVT